MFNSSAKVEPYFLSAGEEVHNYSKNVVKMLENLSFQMTEVKNASNPPKIFKLTPEVLSFLKHHFIH